MTSGEPLSGSEVLAGEGGMVWAGEWTSGG